MASGDIDYRTLAELRYQIRRFLYVREVAARAAGVQPQQYLVLLQLKGLGAPAPISVLAERLQLRHHSTVELINRLVRRGMVRRRYDGPDRRQVLIELRPRGEATLRRLARHSLEELKIGGPAFVAALQKLIGRVPASPTPRSSRRRVGVETRRTRRTS